MKILSNRRYNELITKRDELADKVIELTLTNRDLGNQLDISAEQVEYLQNELSKYKKKEKKNTEPKKKITVKTNKRKEV